MLKNLLPNGNKIAIYNNDNFYATDLFCTMKKYLYVMVLLMVILLNAPYIKCVKISTGEVLESPPTEGLKTYDIKIEENFIFVDVN